jgi:hypothetical protein
MVTWIKKVLGLTNSELFSYVVLIIWVATVIMSFVALLVFEKETGFILTAVSGTFVVVLTDYLFKAFNENKLKYGDGSVDVEKIMSKIQELIK